jgi:hypothetical protein
MKFALLAAAGVHNPQMGNRQVEMASHQGEQPPQHHRLQLTAIGCVDHAAGELVGINRFKTAPHHPDGPILRRLGDRGNRMLAHGS